VERGAIFSLFETGLEESLKRGEGRERGRAREGDFFLNFQGGFFLGDMRMGQNERTSKEVWKDIFMNLCLL
jgi:hypothetical protein